MPMRPEDIDDLPYDWNDEGSILRYAARLTKRSLRDMKESGQEIIGGTRTKGYFGQIVEKEYFGMEPNSSSEPDFDAVGIELKIAPLKKVSNRFESKERMVLGIIDYNDVPKKGFKIFTDKGSHILMLFYHWTPDTDVYDYRFLKVVDWRPSENELRIIKEDWDIIEGFVMRGEAHLLSERHTKFLAANTKGVGHGKDMRSQPFSDIPAKQRSLSFKAPYVTSIYNSCPDINETIIGADDSYPAYDGSIFTRLWEEGVGFEDYVLEYFERFKGMTCQDIEGELGIDIDSNSKQYYHKLVMAMFGLPNKGSVREFDQANIYLKTIRILKNGTPKESMSFPTFNYEEIVEQTWETSDFHDQLDHEFLFPVFSFNTMDTKVDRKSLTFIGAFFWSVPDGDMETIRRVWEDTRDKILRGRFDDFIRASDDLISHVRPHAKDSNDTYTYKGMELVKKSFWLNNRYLKRVIEENLKRNHP